MTASDDDSSASPDTTTIIFVRHADVHNPRDIFYGRLPRFGLSELGRKQARHTAEVLRALPIDVFYTSPQLRARQTLEIIAASHTDIPKHVTHLLAEVLTSWQGRPHVHLEPFHFDFYSRPLSPHDETLEQLWVRIQRFVSRTRRRNACQTVVAVTHGDVVYMTRAGFLGMPVEIGSIRIPGFYPGKGSLLKLAFGPDAFISRPLSIEYWDPNGSDPRYNAGWITLEPVAVKN